MDRGLVWLHRRVCGLKMNAGFTPEWTKAPFKELGLWFLPLLVSFCCHDHKQLNGEKHLFVLYFKFTIHHLGRELEAGA